MLDFNNAPRLGDLDNPFQNDRAEVTRAAIHNNLHSFVRQLFPRAKIARGEARIGSVDGEPGGSLCIQLTGPNAGLWHDHATDEGGDIFALYQAATGLRSFRDVLSECEDWAGTKRLAPRADVAVKTATARHRDKPDAPDEVNKTHEAAHRYLDNGGNLVATVHYYSPFQFTHQGADWVGPDSRQWLGTTWEGTPSQREAVERDMDAALVWAEQQGVPMYLGEFGSLDKADMASRVRWTRFVADAAARRRFGIAYWEFYAGFGLYDPAAEDWRNDLTDAVLGTSAAP